MSLITFEPSLRNPPVLTRVEIRVLRDALRAAKSGSLRMGELHDFARAHGLTPWKHGFRWPISERAYAAYVAANTTNRETSMGLDLSEATRVDRAAKGIASDAIRAIGLIAQIDADEAADVCRGVTDLIGKFRSEVIAAARRGEYPDGYDPFDSMQVVATVQAG